MSVKMPEIQAATEAGNHTLARQLAGEAIEETIDRARDRLADYRARHGLTSWEETFDRLLEREDEVLS